MLINQNKLKSTGAFVFGVVLSLLIHEFAVSQAASSVVHLEQDQYTVVRELNTENGLPANGVNSVIQDSRGYIWAATYNGLVRYDGKRIVVYDTSNIPGLETNRFKIVKEDRKGRIWAGLEYSNLVIIDHEQERSEVFIIEDEILGHNPFLGVIFFGDHDDVWIGTSRGLALFREGSFSGFEDLPNQTVHSVTQKGDDLYIVFDHYIYRLDKDGHTKERVAELSDGNIQYRSNYTITFFDEIERFRDVIWHDDSILLTHEAGIVKMADNSYQILLTREDIEESIIHRLIERDNEYYIYGAEGFYKVEGLFEDEKKVNKYLQNRVMGVHFDHENTAWLATTASGLLQVIQTPVYQGDTYSVLNNIPLTAILEDSDENIWIGTNCDGLYRFSGREYRRFNTVEGGIGNTCVWSVMEQTDGTIWAGTWGGGVYYLSPGSDQFQRFLPDIMTEADAVLSVFEDSEGNVWFGSYYQGLFRFDGNETVSVKNESGRILSSVRSFYEDASGTILVASDRGIGYYENGIVQKPDQFDQLQTRNFRTINKDSQGRFWFGSYGGGLLIYSSEGSFKKLTTKNGLNDDTISQVGFDSDDNLWLAGNMGVFFIENEQIEQFLSGETGEVRVSRIGVEEGLPIRETNGGFMPSSLLNDRGEMFIPTVQGLAIVNTEQMQLNRNLPNVYLEEIEIDGIVYRPWQLDKINFDVQRIIFRFTALSFKNPGNVHFDYMLQGFDSDWQRSSNVREAVYTGMPPGDYSFNIRASNNDGFWTTEGVYFAVTVSPPYWQTWWFFLIAGVFCVALLFFGYHNRVKNIRKYNQRLQKRVEERTSELKVSNQELKKLIEEKNKLMSVLAHDLRNPFTAIMGYIELLKMNFEENNDHDNLEMTSMLLDSGRNTLNLLENLLQWSGAKEGGLEPDFKLIEINELIREGIAMTEAQSIYKQIKVINKNKKPYWVRADRNMILSVIRNLISNGIKFSGVNSVVEIDVKEMDTEIAISVKDRGVGIQHNDLRLLFSSNGARQKLGTQGEKGIGLGLQMCKEFVHKHNCKIWAESKPGQGSTFYFTLQKEMGRAEEAEMPERNEKARTG